jgi:hypothetical protein
MPLWAEKSFLPLQCRKENTTPKDSDLKLTDTTKLLKAGVKNERRKQRRISYTLLII